MDHLIGSNEMIPYSSTFDLFNAPNILGFQNDFDNLGWMTGSLDPYLRPMSFDLGEEFDILQNTGGPDATTRQTTASAAAGAPLGLPPTPASDIADLYGRSHSSALDKDTVEVRQYHPTSIDVDATLHFPDVDPASLLDAELEKFAHVDPLTSEKVHAITQLAEEIQREPYHPPSTNTKLPPQPILNAWVQLYFEYFHPVFPILHKPTFLLPEVDPLLILAVADLAVHDHPKLWSKPLKMIVLANICLMVFNGNFHAASITTSFGVLIAEFRVGYPDIAPLVSYSVLVIGLGCLLWTLAGVVFEKRLVLIVANLIFLAGCIWSVYSKSLESLLGSRVLASFGAGAVQAVRASVVGEVFFERDYSSAVLIISVTTAQLFSPPPFLFTPVELGNGTGIAFVGIILALPIAGPVTNALSRWMTKLNSRHEPEYRLYSIVIPFLLCSPGLLLFGYTYIKGSHQGPAVGYAMQATGLVLVPAIVLSYASDSYPYDSAEVMAFVNALTHLIPFAISKIVPKWLARDAVKKLFIGMAVIQWAIFFGITMLLIIFGRRFGRRRRGSTTSTVTSGLLDSCS
ncbi:hypothetical protein BU25DRAFT_488863 [Macroventuria anomochaeta]|uniref:Uncharacterized protein n=1 Tax=Macroventuria anomochaeta TaxID=301207 RepID=A0ACB6S9H0_9PLEO|nr:uncharacterized protein BU25DRAFT_488863 [Macroventuria anomochaeta]KAF2630709.1 hypothetical protein BU25DRAFT_488863 [Macroventuria anomochaeta]